MADIAGKTLRLAKEKKKAKPTDALTSRERKRIQWWAKKKEAAKEEKDASTDEPQTKKQKIFDDRGFKKSQNQSDTGQNIAKDAVHSSDISVSPSPATKEPQKKLKVKKKKAGDEISPDGDVDHAENRTKGLDDFEGSDSQVTADGGTKKKKKRYILFVGNLPFDVTEDDIRKHFQRAGCITEIRLLTNKETGKPRGCGYIEMETHNAHRRAVQMHETDMRGRKINVEFTSAGRKTEKRSEHLKNKNRKLAKLKWPQYPAMPTRVKKPAGPGMYKE